MIYLSIPFLTYIINTSKTKLEGREGINSFLATLTDILVDLNLYAVIFIILISSIMKIQAITPLLILLIPNTLVTTPFAKERYLVLSILYVILQMYHTNYVLNIIVVLLMTAIIRNTNSKLTVRIFMLGLFTCPLINITLTLIVSMYEALYPKPSYRYIKNLTKLYLILLVFIFIFVGVSR